MTRKILLLPVVFALCAIFSPDFSSAASRKFSIDFNEGSLSGSEISAVSAEDGVPEIVAVEGKKYLRIDATKTKMNGDMGLLYFNVNDKLAFNVSVDCLLYVAYENDVFCYIQAQYDSKTCPYGLAMGVGSTATGLGGPRTAVFLLRDAKFGGGQNSGADFRLLLNKNVKIASVEIVSAGKDPDKAFKKILDSDFDKINPGDDFDVCFGGLDGSKPADLDGLLGTLESKLPFFAELGATSKESYVRWNLVEREKGKYDFSYYDKQVAIHERCGIKWVPFVIIGPAYSLPNWFYNSKERVDYVCLEHGQKCDVQSLWNPHLRKYIDAFMRQFARHYDKEQIESILLGITGNYGESIYVASGSDWTSDAHGPYHTHTGFWCGDEYARQSWREWVEKKYTNIQALNEAWNTKFESFEPIQPDKNVKGQQWLDFVEWYRESMTDWAEFWVATTRRYFPSTAINLCTGGDMRVEHGLDLSAQAKMCAKYKAGIRITNEASDYALNYRLTRLCASACRFYGIDFGFEPAGMCTPTAGVIARMYNATASGCNHLHFYENIICNQTESIKTWTTNAHHLKRRNPTIECALLYPFTSQTQTSRGFPSDIQAIRDMVDVNWIDERMVLDGALERNRILFIDEGDVFPAEVLEKIEKWIHNGGTLIAPSGKRIEDLDGGCFFANNYLTGQPGTFSQKACGKGHVILVPDRIASADTVNVLAGKTKVEGFEPIAWIEADVAAGIGDNIFVTYFEDCALVLNFNDKAVTKKFLVGGKPKEFPLAAYSIIEIPRKAN